MKAENETTGHNRIIKITDLPSLYAENLSELSITIHYVSKENEDGVLAKASALDHFVIPKIIKALNQNNC